MTTVFLRTPYNYDTDHVSEETGLYCPPEESRTQQSQRDDADINVIVRRFGLTGQLPDNIRVPQYGDFTNITNYHDAMNAVIRANGEFARLPANIRTRFNNSPEQFVEFCMNEENIDEMIRLGLIEKRPDGDPKPPVSGEPSAPEPKATGKS